MSRLKATLLAASLLVAGAGGVAYAQMGSTYDPDQLPTIKGKVVQYLPTPRGEVDGFILEDGTEVHVLPHLSSQLVFAVKPGDSVTIHGLKARAIPMVAAVSVTNDASNVTVADGGLARRRDAAEVTVQGTVKIPLHGLRGEVNGVLLADGTVVHLPPPEARKLGDQLDAGKPLVVHGAGYSGDLGKAIFAREIGPDSAHLVHVVGPHPGWERGHWLREHAGLGRWGHGPGKEDGAGEPPPPPQ
jgi:hypothetical protein